MFPKYSLKLMNVLVVLLIFGVKLYSQEISISKQVYAPNENIEISYRELPKTGQHWLAISKRYSTNDSYIELHKTGVIMAGINSFDSLGPGEYEARLYLNWPSGGYKIERSQHFSVINEPSSNESVNQIDDDSNIDQLAYNFMFLSIDEIIDEMKVSDYPVDFARLEATYKRKILELFHDHRILEYLEMPTITISEIETIEREYIKLEKNQERWSLLAEMYFNLKYLFDDTHDSFVNERVRRIFSSEIFIQFFSTVGSRDKWIQTYIKTSDASVVKDFWRIQLGTRNNLKVMDCKDYKIYCFEDRLDSDNIQSISNLKVKELELFYSIGLNPPLFPPFKAEVDNSCVEMN